MQGMKIFENIQIKNILKSKKIISKVPSLVFLSIF
jgi:hypothetical protein